MIPRIAAQTDHIKREQERTVANLIIPRTRPSSTRGSGLRRGQKATLEQGGGREGACWVSQSVGH